MKVVGNASPCLMEPVMQVEVQVQEDDVGPVVSDLTGKRRAMIKEIVARNAGADTEDASQFRSWSMVKAEVPLKEMIGTVSLVCASCRAD